MSQLTSLTVAALWLHEVVGGVFAHTLPLDMSLLASNFQLDDGPLLRQRKHKPNFFANSHRSFTVNLFHVSHDFSACSPLHTKHSSLAPEFAWVSFRTSFFFLNHLDLFKLNLGFSFPGFSLVLAQPKAISWTWPSISSHSSKSLRVNFL